MSQTIVQINFDLAVSAEEYELGAGAFAEPIADVDGLEWKVWFVDSESRRGGGIYLFKDAAAAKAYLEGPVVAEWSQMPAFRHIQVDCFDVLQAPTAITRGPVAAAPVEDKWIVY